MALDPDQKLDPTTIASREFSSSFRGYDVDEVRVYLRGLSDLVRQQQSGQPANDHDSARVSELLSERKEFLATIAKLEDELSSAKAEVVTATERADAAEASSDPSTWDESKIDALVGEETAHVLEAARTAASSIRTRAEADVEARLKIAEERQRSTEAEIAEKRQVLAEETAKLVADAEAKATKLAEDSEAEAAKLLSDAKENASTSDTAAHEAAEALRTEAAAEADHLRAEAEEAAASMRAEGEADLLNARDRAREETQLMLAEAQSVREKVLADLVKRRRTGRTQLDQIKAARDRMARSLAVVRRELDEAIDELAISVPEAKAAMEEVGRSAQSGPDERVVLDLASELDRQRAREAAGVAEVDAVEVVEAVAEKQAAASATSEQRSGSKATTDAKKAAAESAPEPAKTEPAKTGSEKTEPAKTEAAKAEPAKTGSEKAAAVDAGVSKTKAEAAKDASKADSGKASTGKAESAKAEAASSADAATAKTAAVEADREPKIPTLFANLRDNAAQADDGPELADVDDEVVIDLDDDTDDGIEVPQVFMDRDVSMTRFGPSLRRQLKRALADDQSDVLDRVRQAKKKITLEDLPPVERQVLAFIDAVTDSLQGAALAGAEAAGDSTGAGADDAVGDLIEQLATSVAKPLRARVERSITGVDGDKEEVLEPIRANYRDARSNDVPQLADDALAEAFAIGVYTAVANNTKVVWVADPRHEATADCHDNALAGAVKKPAAFPTGLKMPLGGPGCRCLVVSEAMAKVQLIGS